MKLASMNCEPTRKESKALDENEIQTYLMQVPEWQMVQEDGIPRLRRQYKFKNFVQALTFTNAVGQLAEDQDHHPLLVTEWGRVTVTWWTHVIKGLHLNDFIMAARCDQAYTS